MEFTDVDYWSELTKIMEWSKHVFSTLHICWGAQAGLFYHYGVPKYPLPNKMFGIFPHWINQKQLNYYGVLMTSFGCLIHATPKPNGKILLNIQN